MTNSYSDYSDYIVYVDESGTSSMNDEEYPVFCFAFCIFDGRAYLNRVVPDFRALKHRHNVDILHGNEIRRSGSVSIKKDLTELIGQSPFHIIASVIRKPRLQELYEWRGTPDKLALLLCMRQLLRWLVHKGEAGKAISIVFESRGRKNDEALKREFCRIINGTPSTIPTRLNFRQMKFVPSFVTKPDNEIGTQVADLVAGPIAQHVLHPQRGNLAYSAFKEKLVAPSPEVFP